MRLMTDMRLMAALMAFLLLPAMPALAEPVGHVVSTDGLVYRQRGNERVLLKVGMEVETDDILHTLDDGEVSVVFLDNTALAMGPETLVRLDDYLFDPSTYDGYFEITVEDGTLGIQAGKLKGGVDPRIRIRTEQSVLGVRGTRLVVDGGRKMLEDT